LSSGGAQLEGRASSAGPEAAAVSSNVASSRRTPFEADKPALRPHEALHDEFFDAGEQGMYDGGHGASTLQALDEDELEGDGTRVVRRTPEQERRRNKMMQVVGLVVGSVLGVLIFAVLAARGRSTPPEPKPDQGTHPNEPAVAPPAAVQPTTPPNTAPASPAADVTSEPPPADADSTKLGGDKPGPRSNDAGASRPRGAGEPAPAPVPAPGTPAQPRRPLLPLPPSKPPTASFPD
jgi:hypothetical protein